MGINPEFAMHKLASNFSNIEVIDVVESSFRFGSFIGVDVGINSLITISPLLYFNYSPSVQLDKD